jgi:hypothetical protein
MRLATRIGAAAGFGAVALTALALPALAEDRSQLLSCEAMLDRAAQAANEKAAEAKPDTPELLRCRQIVREWMLRDARMSVDERGQPLRW